VLTPILILVAALVVAGVTAMAAPDPRLATLGAFGAVVLAALVVDPPPQSAAIAAHVLGGVLGGWLVWTAIREVPRTSARSALGWQGATAVAVVAFAIGFLAASALGAMAAGIVGSGTAAVAGGQLAGGSLVSRAAIGAAAALGVLAAPAVVLPRDGLRLGLGVVVLVSAASLLSNALSPAPDDALELAFGLLAAITGAALALAASTMLRTGGDLILREVLAREPAVRHRAADDAHREAGA
jgi:hypothetical protein